MKSRQGVIVGCLCLWMLSTAACRAQYLAEPIQAQVVDAASNEPLDGVVVVAHWVLKFGRAHAGSEDLIAMETVTDEQGRFRFPGWGPIPVPAELPADARLEQQDPEIILFKSGYRWRGLYNSDSVGPFKDSGPSVRTSQWNGKVIALTKFEGSREDYARQLDGVTTTLELTDCRWKKIPRLLAAVDRDTKELRRQNVRQAYGGQTTIEDIEGFSVGDSCGPVKEFFEEYVK